MVEEVVQYVEDGSFRLDQFLKIFRMEIVPVHIDGGKEYGFHLIVPKLVSGLMSRDENLKIKEHRKLNI